MIRWQPKSFRLLNTRRQRMLKKTHVVNCSCSAMAQPRNSSQVRFVSSHAASRIVNIVPASGVVPILLL